MGVVFVKCPITGREFSTGVETDGRSFELIPDMPMQAHCPYCATRHSWTKRDARLSEIDAPTERIAVAS
jgi:hypothetical protein